MRPQSCIRPTPLQGATPSAGRKPRPPSFKALVGKKKKITVNFAEFTRCADGDQVTMIWKMDKDETCPSLNVIQKKKKIQHDETLVIPQDPEELRLAQAAAWISAYKLHCKVMHKEENYRQDAQKFFESAKAKSPRPLAVSKQDASPSSIKVGTDCSGIEAPIQALRNLQVDFSHVFSCDDCPDVIKSMKANFQPLTHYPDITKRDNATSQYVDIYVAGFPCQPFSTAGKQQGFEDAKGRGTIFYNVLDYIEVHRPKVFILENVKGLVTMAKGKHVKKILKALHDIKKPGENPGTGVRGESSVSAYEIHHDILNTKDHGVPQSRPRWYCIGILKETFAGSEKSTFEFPQTLTCPSIDLFLDSSKSATAINQVGNTSRRNIEKARSKIISDGRKPDEEPYIVDCDASTSCSRHTFNFSPCITASRYQGHWITHRGRRMTKEEMFRLQGMDPTQFVVDIPANALGRQIGNAMSVNVVERLISRALEAANLKPKSNIEGDRWANGTALKELSNTRGKSFKPKAKGNPGPVVQSAKPDDRVIKRIMPLKGSRQKRMLIIDSGASFHLMQFGDLTPSEYKTMRKMEVSILLETANGEIESEYETEIWVHELKMFVTAVLLDDTPAVLSLGKLVEQNGFDYIWKTRTVPFLQKGTLKVFCYPVHDVPFICTSTPAESNLVPASSSQSPADKEAERKLEQPAGAKAGEKRVTSIRGTPETIRKAKDAANIRSENAKARRKAKKRIVSCSTCEHNIFTHFPKDPDCEICARCKPHRAYCKSKEERSPDALPEPKAWLDSITLDHKILNDDDASRKYDKTACVIQDRHTYWLQSYAAKTKSSADTKKAVQKFAGPQGR